MAFQEHTTPERLERYSFLWSELRLLVAALALFLGGVPPVIALLPFSALYGLVGALLTLAWLVSGIAAGYLLYRWFKAGKRVLGGSTFETVAFFIMVVSGLNLGLAGLSGANIGMSISSNQILFYIVGVLYIASAYYLYRRWNENGQKLFPRTAAASNTASDPTA